MRIFVVGVGNLGSAIVRSLLHSYAPRHLVLLERAPEDRKALKAQHGCHVVGELSEECRVEKGDLLILSVKPQDALQACANLARFVSPDAVVLSVMAGIRIDALAEVLKTKRIVRAMPNLGASIDESATGYYYCGDSLTASDVDHVESLISRLGKRWRVAREELIDAITAVAGSGPAYLCWLGEQIERVAIEFGISQEDAHAIVLQTFRGTALYLEQSGYTFSELRRRVTSPQGTTAAAISVLTDRAADTSVRDAITAACTRARELGA
jgi:pyrroline-5-carboxylate reductase